MREVKSWRVMLQSALTGARTSGIYTEEKAMLVFARAQADRDGIEYGTVGPADEWGQAKGPPRMVFDRRL